MAEPLTDRQAEVLAAIEKLVWKTGISPSQRAIGKLLRIPSVRAVQKHLGVLADKGYLRLHPGRDYGIELLRGLKVPVVSTIAAGTPIEAEENIEEWIDIPPGLCRRKPDALARVKGRSMEGAPTHIRHGDLIGVYKAQTATPGQVAVFAIPSSKTDREELTVKEYRVKGGSILLVPHNPDEKQMQFTEGDIRIVGLYAGGLIRRA